jgi:uncharacterized protein YbjT (DUF2867 family)
MYVVTGATGHTGKRTAEQLLKAGKEVIVVSRSAEKVADLIAKGAKAAIGDLTDINFLASTFKGATAVYAMIPPSFAVSDFRAYQNEIGKSLTEAIRQSGVKHVVTLSSVGAHSDQTGVVAGLFDFEAMLKSIPGINVLHLRAGFFMQNLFNNIGIIKNMGINAGFPIDGKIKLAVVHTNDIGDVAAKRMLALDFHGHTHTYVAGNSDVSLEEITQVLGQAIGKPDLQWVSFPYDQAYQGMIQTGMPETIAQGYIEFGKATNEGILNSDYKRLPEYTTPTSIADFAKEFAAAWQASQN